MGWLTTTRLSRVMTGLTVAIVVGLVLWPTLALAAAAGMLVALVLWVRALDAQTDP